MCVVVLYMFGVVVLSVYVLVCVDDVSDSNYMILIVCVEVCYIIELLCVFCVM